MEELIRVVLSIINEYTTKIILSNPFNKEDLKVEIVKNNNDYVINNKKINLIDYLNKSIIKYKQVNIWDNNYSYNIRLTKKEKVLISKTKVEENVNFSHNRKKNYILKEGMIIEPLIDLGIFTKEGKIVNSMYDKYRQINRFLEIIDDVLKEGDFKKLNIIDFGCGKSYLTFVVYYYLTEIKNIEVKMIGLDLKEEVINNCNLIAQKYHYQNLSFKIGDIGNYKIDEEIDMVITLHACDIATDYALYNAIKWNVKMIFSVPCCQHELNSQINTENFKLLTRYGIVKERFSALLTDVIRCNILAINDYKTQLLEFIDFTHTPKNLLIRAVKSNISSKTKKIMQDEIDSVIKEYNLRPKLVELLKEDQN